MQFVVHIGVLCLLVVHVGSAPVVNSSTDAQEYLQRFGYTPSTQLGSMSAITDKQSQLRKALIRFQVMAGIPQTGLLDEKTMEMMNTPRCAVSDNGGSTATGRRRKRYALQGSKWPSKALKYNFLNYSQKMSQSVIRARMEKAFKYWSDASALSFTESTNANIDILFGVKAHGDDTAFDGVGGVLAHAYYPNFGGDVHFDDDEVWTDAMTRGTNFLQVATHELGHSLGLSHSNLKTAVMTPFYYGYQANFQLNQDDITAIRYLYGAPEPAVVPVTVKPVQPLPTVPVPEYPDICSDGVIDAIVTVNNYTYAFKGDYYYRMDNKVLVAGRPQLIRDTWPQVGGFIDTAFYLAPLAGEPGELLLFKGDKYWRYENISRLSTTSTYPRYISDDFRGVPSNLDAAFVWGVNSKLYFVKGNEYYRYTRKTGMDADFPRPMTVWAGVPTPVRTAFTWPANNRTYFFGNSDYYRFDDKAITVEEGFPRSTAVWWFGC